MKKELLLLILISVFGIYLLAGAIPIFVSFLFSLINFVIAKFIIILFVIISIVISLSIYKSK